MARPKTAWLSFGGLFFVQVGTDRESVVGVDGGVAFFDVLNDTVFVDDDVGALGPLVGFGLHVVAFEDAVGGEHFFVHVTEKRKLNIDLLGEGGVGRWRIHTDAKNFGVGGVNFSCVDSRLDRLELLGSTTGEGENVDGKEHIFLTVKITELDGFPLIAKETEIGRGVANFERDLSDLVGFLGRRDWRCE
jgi:hypothetical protein